jgi:hypothetical protein
MITTYFQQGILKMTNQKKIYTTPDLQQLGKISEVTQQNGPRSESDNISNPQDKARSRDICFSPSRCS